MKYSHVIRTDQMQRICSSSFLVLAERYVDILLVIRGVDRVVIPAVCPRSLHKHVKLIKQIK